METPAFLVDELRRLTGPGGLVENATDLLIDAGRACAPRTRSSSWPRSSTPPARRPTASGAC